MLCIKTLSGLKDGGAKPKANIQKRRNRQLHPIHESESQSNGKQPEKRLMKSAGTSAVHDGNQFPQTANTDQLDSFLIAPLI